MNEQPVWRQTRLLLHDHDQKLSDLQLRVGMESTRLHILLEEGRDIASDCSARTRELANIEGQLRQGQSKLGMLQKQVEVHSQELIMMRRQMQMVEERKATALVELEHDRIEDADTLASFAKQIMIMKESLARTASTDVTV
ncbi:hypothetical protein ACKKBG_A01810 [Auxenochlorella protothecoides x Auxenochlorella symbiontica]